MQRYWNLTSKPKHMEKITQGLHLNSKKNKRCMKSKQLWNTKEGERDINTLSNGKDIQSKKQCGNQKQTSPKMETCWHNTNFDINSNMMIKTIIKKAKSWSFLRSSWRIETNHLIPPVPSFKPPQITVYDPQGQHVEDLDENYKETHPFHRLNKQDLQQIPLSELFPDLSYKSKWLPTFPSPHPLSMILTLALPLLRFPHLLLNIPMNCNPDKLEILNHYWLSSTLMKTSKNSLDYWTDKQPSRKCWLSIISTPWYDEWSMKYRGKSQKPQCYLMMSLPWRNHDNYECISRRITADEHDRSLPNLYQSFHLFHPHLHHLFPSLALLKIPSTSTQGLENLLSKSRTTPNQQWIQEQQKWRRIPLLGMGQSFGGQWLGWQGRLECHEALQELQVSESRCMMVLEGINVQLTNGVLVYGQIQRDLT